jgi:hypothetical protein
MRRKTESLWKKYGKRLTEIYGIHYDNGIQTEPVCRYCGIMLISEDEKTEIVEILEKAGELPPDNQPVDFIDFGDATVDHIIPVSMGGTDEIENLVPCCRVCNSKKGNRNFLTVEMRSEPVSPDDDYLYAYFFKKVGQR